MVELLAQGDTEITLNDFNSAVQNGHKGLNLIVTDLMTRAAEDPSILADLGIPPERLTEFSQHTSRLGNALGYAGIGSEIISGDVEGTRDAIMDKIAGDILSEGFGDVLGAMTRDSFIQRHGYSPSAQAYHEAMTGHVAGLGADIAVEGARLGAELLVETGNYVAERYYDNVSAADHARTVGFQVELDAVQIQMLRGGIGEYNALGDPEQKTYEFDGTNGAGLTTSLGDTLLQATNDAANTLYADQGLSFRYPDHRMLPGLYRSQGEDLQEFVQIRPDDVSPTPTDDFYARFDLDVLPTVGADVRTGLENFTYLYSEQGNRNEGRAYTTEVLEDAVNTIEREADYAYVDLAMPRTADQMTNDTYYGRIRPFSGVMSAASDDGGAIMVGRDGGIMRGSNYGDLMLDATDVNAQGGDDVAILNADRPGEAAMGAGDDIVIGGLKNDALHGGVGRDRLYGDAGDDVIYGTGKPDSSREVAEDDGVQDILEGGRGVDVLHAGDNDIVIAGQDDKQDTINFNGITLDGPDIENHPPREGQPFIGRNGETYSLSDAGDSVTVEYNGQSMEVVRFQNGDFGFDFPEQREASNNAMPSQSGVVPVRITEAAVAPMALEDAVQFMSGNAESIRADIAAREAAGTATPEEQALGQVLQTPESATVFGDLDAAGVTELDVDLPAEATPTQTGVAIYDAVGTAVDANNIAVSTPDAAAAPENSIPENTTPTQVAEATAENEYGTYI